MPRPLNGAIQDQITKKDVGITFIFKIDSTDFTSYLINWDISIDKTFGSQSATFTLNNDDSRFGINGVNEINVGDIVEFSEYYGSDVTEWKRFYGQVTQRSVTKSGNEKSITINCLDYISTLQHLDIDLEVEGTKVEVENERLTPNYLSVPNDSLAQVFDFANNSIATTPMPIIMIRDRYNDLDDLQNDGFDIYYENGQLRLGSPINAKDNYFIVVKKYSYYLKGVYAEDILEDILTESDGYSKYLFNESSAADVITNHLTTTYHAEEGTNIDVMIPNYLPSTITIETTLASNISAGATSVTLADSSGFPTSGTASINGDTFTFTSNSSNVLSGIPASGSNALKAHSSGDYVEYENEYDSGQVWYLSYSNVSTNLTLSDFTIPGNKFKYLDKRYGRIILTSAIHTTSTVTCNTDYTFKTLQATGVELNKISFRSREVSNRFEAINKLRKYLAPNYIVRTQGDDKIWASYLSQKTNEDYDLELVEQINYLEDEDLYTRVVMYGKSKNPSNIMFKDGVDFVTTGEQYKSLASQVELSYDSDYGNYYKYVTTISNAGYIDLEDITPIVYINGVAIDNTLKQMVALPVTVDVQTWTQTRSGCHGISKENYVKIHTYYYYKVIFPHTSIEPSQPIYLYNAQGGLVKTLGSYDLNMDYGRGIWNVPGTEKNSDIETLSTATYYVMYSTGKLNIDYDNVVFYIEKSLIPERGKETVTATFEYWSVMTEVSGIASIIDGRWDTQVQTEFYSEPPSGYNYAIIDLGQTYTIQAMDMTAGFFKPDGERKIDINISCTIQYSTDNVSYSDISDTTNNFSLAGGESIQFEEEDLGVNLQARYLKLILENVERIDFEDGVWVVAIAEVSAYNDIYLKSESTLIATTKLTDAVANGAATLPVVDTSQFTSSGTLYLNGDGFTGNVDDEVTYTGKTATSFTGCSGVLAQSNGIRVSQTLESDTTIYDDDGLLEKLGDRVYKDVRISDEVLYTQTELDRISKAFLDEFYKNHTKISVDVLYAPHLRIGQTIKVTDTYNNIDQNYFIEAITDRNGYYSLVLAYYPD